MRHSGFSLLEILVAIAVLLIGLAAIVRLASLSQQESQGAEDLAIVQLACQTKINEILAANNHPIPFGSTEAIQGVRSWQMTVEQMPVSRQGLIGIRILAEKRTTAPASPNQRYELVRWTVPVSP